MVQLKLEPAIAPRLLQSWPPSPTSSPPSNELTACLDDDYVSDSYNLDFHWLDGPDILLDADLQSFFFDHLHGPLHSAQVPPLPPPSHHPSPVAPRFSNSRSTSTPHPPVPPSHSSSRSAKPRRPKCTVDGCDQRVRSRGVCKRHGGGRLCLIPDCQNSAVGLEYCVSHGGGKGCLREECTKAAQVGGYCKAHGGGSRCQIDGCKKSSQTNGRCRLHGGGKRCTAPGCTKGAQRLGLCAAHGGYHICQHESGCPRKDRGGGYCETHRRDLECSSVGCKRLRKAHGLCTTHLRVGDHNDLMAILDELLDMPKQRLR